MGVVWVIGDNAAVGGNGGIGGNAPVLSVVDPAVVFVCPRCGRASTHPADAEAGYCGHCSDWTGERGAGAMGPVCAEDADDGYPDPPVHESCAGARVFADGDAWLFLGRTIVLEEMPG